MRVFLLSVLSLLTVVAAWPVMAAEGAGGRPLRTAPSADALAIDALIVRGDAFMARHDVASARLFYELAAAEGHAQAAAKLGMTYDPLYLQSLGVRGYSGNAQSALDWYGTAANRGDRDSTLRLDRLQARLAGGSTIAPGASPPPTPTPAEPLLKEPPAVGPADIRVQLAAARSQHAALVEAVRLRVNFPGLLGDKELLVRHLNAEGGPGFGVWSEPLMDKLAADKLCAALRAKSQTCVVVP